MSEMWWQYCLNLFIYTVDYFRERERCGPTGCLAGIDRAMNALLHITCNKDREPMAIDLTLHRLWGLRGWTAFPGINAK